MFLLIYIIVNITTVIL